MNILSWNCRGLRNPQTEQELGDLIRAHSPSIVFVAETWLKKARLISLRDKWKFDGMIDFSREGRGGGVAVFWKKEMDFSVDTYSPNHIDAVINKGKEGEWRFTGFYSEPDTNSHFISWATLRRLKSKFSLTWSCAGDFNEIIRAHEKLGGRQRPNRQMEEFGDVLDECGFQDLAYCGNKFTWCNRHGEGHTMWERLDRAVGTTKWLSMFPATKAVHLECGTSDHKPILIHLLGIPK